MTPTDAHGRAVGTLNSKMRDLDLRLATAADQIARADEGQHVRK